MTREESGELFGEQVGCHPCFMAEVVARQGRFVEFDVNRFCRGPGIDGDAEYTGDGRQGGAARSLRQSLAGCFPYSFLVRVRRYPGQRAGNDARQVGRYAPFINRSRIRLVGPGGRGHGEKRYGVEERLG